ncbi:MAG: hypothetical protein ACLFPS_07205 [Clostridia bacterium]
MSNKNKYYFALIVVGIIVFAIGIYLSRDAGFSIMSTILITLGALGFGFGIGEIIQNNLIDRNKRLLKTIEKQNNPERLIFLNNQAKASAFDLLTKAFPIFILVLAITRENLNTLLILIGLYIMIWVIYLLHLNKLYKNERRKVE